MPIAGTGRIYYGSSLIFEPGGGGSLIDQWPIFQQNTTDVPVVAASSIRTVRTQGNPNASATPHTIGTWVEYEASLAHDACGVLFNISTSLSQSGVNSSAIMHISLGTAGNEAANIWASIPVGYNAIPGDIWVPGFIPSGSRVTFGLQSAIASQTSTVIVRNFFPVKSTLPSAPVMMGVNLGTSQGVTVTAPGSLNTKGAWTEIEDVTSQDFSVLLVGIQGAGGTAMNVSGVLVDIGIGAASSETVLVPDIYLAGQSSEWYSRSNGFQYLLFPVEVPAGSRLSARYQRAHAGNAVDLALLGVG